MSHRGSDVFPGDSANSSSSAADGAANRSQSPVPADPRLLGLIDAWPTLPDAARNAIATLAGISPDDAENQDAATTALTGEAGSR